ncbi:MAG: ABC transporter ATP-binding protein, partial [Planctomycetota bacterium]
MTAANHPLTVDDVSHRFGSLEAVRSVSITVAAGTVHALLGQSGSGKSTLLRIIAGLERPHQGSIRLGNQTVCDHACFVPTQSRAVGFVFQDYALFPHLSVIRNVMFGMSGGNRSRRRQQALDWLRRVDMASSADVYPHTLSGGQQQRVALVRALARQPNIMLLDEPFSGLDPSLRSEVREMTVNVLKQAGVATLLVTHDPLEALAAGDRVSVMHEGRLVQTGDPETLVCNPSDDSVAKIFEHIRLLEKSEVSLSHSNKRMCSKILATESSLGLQSSVSGSPVCTKR